MALIFMKLDMTPPIIEIPLPYEEFIRYNRLDNMFTPTDPPLLAFVDQQSESTLTMFLLPLSLVRTRADEVVDPLTVSSRMFFA